MVCSNKPHFCQKLSTVLAFLKHMLKMDISVIGYISIDLSKGPND